MFLWSVYVGFLVHKGSEGEHLFPHPFLLRAAAIRNSHNILEFKKNKSVVFNNSQIMNFIHYA